MKYVVCMAMVFMSGVVTAMNVIVLTGTTITDYEAHWGKVVFALILAAFFANTGLEGVKEKT